MVQSVKKGDGYPITFPACFIELDISEGKTIGGGVTQYPDARMYFHIYSNQLNSENPDGEFMDRNIEIYELADTIQSNMHHFRTHGCTQMLACVNTLDYKHNTITKFIVGFQFMFSNDKGSVYDENSYLYQTVQTATNPTLGITDYQLWISGNVYTQLVNVVWFSGNLPTILAGYYLCTVSNNSTEFTPSEWQILAIWVSGKTYTIGQYIYNGQFCYECIVANSDLIFNPGNWLLTTKM